MTDMLIDGTISKKVYDEKVIEFTVKEQVLDEFDRVVFENIIEKVLVGALMRKENLIHTS